MAQTGTGGASPMYDVKMETTIRSSVESIDTVTGAGGRGRGADGGGTHLTVKIEKAALEVHVGPAPYLLRSGSRLPRATRSRFSARAQRSTRSLS
jgi:hypothetical protein